LHLGVTNKITGRQYIVMYRKLNQWCSGRSKSRPKPFGHYIDVLVTAKTSSKLLRLGFPRRNIFADEFPK
jgi:hypothetical protein